MRIFSQPYPLSDKSSTKWRIALVTGIFIWLFLYLFRPFGLNSIPSANALWVIVGYGMITTLCLLLNLFLLPLFLPSVFNEERWTVLHEFIHTLWIILTIGIGNALYTNSVFKYELSLSGFLYFQLVTLAIAILPVSFIILLKQNRLLRRNRRSAEKISGRINRYKKMEVVDNKQATLTGENAVDSLSINSGDILYLNAADNYIEVVYLQEGQVKRKVLRNTLKSARSQLNNFSSFYRCHRSWIVNLDRVTGVKGNAQGYRLQMDATEVQIPVSRSLNDELSSRLAK